MIRVDSRYFRPTEVNTLLGDPQKAKDKLGWTPKINLETLISEMIKNDLEIAQQSNLRSRVGNL